MPAHLLVIVAIGATIGFLGGLLGKGGSAIATPILVAFGVPPIVALAAPLPATVPGTLVAADSYRREGHIDRDVLVWSLVAGVPATILGAYASKFVDAGALVLGQDGDLTEAPFAGVTAELRPRDDRCVDLGDDEALLGDAAPGDVEGDRAPVGQLGMAGTRGVQPFVQIGVEIGIHAVEPARSRFHRVVGNRRIGVQDGERRTRRHRHAALYRIQVTGNVLQ
mgnify:CR=1 FL=1